MSIGILASKTGNGHISVMNTLHTEFAKQGYMEVECFPDFYESMMVSNKILSNFYNFLMVNSTQLCEKYCEFTYLTRPDLSADFYEGVKKYIIEFITNHNFETIISVTHTINYSMIRILEELNLTNKIKYYIVVTDPYEPIAVGFAVRGATKYYCANDIVENILIKSKVNPENIVISGYPINSKFSEMPKSHDQIFNDLQFNSKESTLLINSGSQGIYYYYDFLKKISQDFHKIQIIFVCGQNEMLFQQASRYVEKNDLKNRVKIFRFVDNMQDYITISDLVITKAGANSFFEVLNLRKPILIDAINGFLFQEKGVVSLIRDYEIGKIVYSINDLSIIINKMLESSKKTFYESKIQQMRNENGSQIIVSDILSQEQKM